MKVVSIGMFAGGSFGRPGNPSLVYEYFAVDTEHSAAARESICQCVAFTSRGEAEARLAELQARAAADQAAAARAEQVEIARRATGNEIRREITRHIGADVSGIRWSDRLIGDEMLSPESVEAVDGLIAPKYDAAVDGRFFRVQLLPFAGNRVVEIFRR